MRSRAPFAWAAALVAILGLAVPAAWHVMMDLLGPLDLTAAWQGSPVVLDRDGRLLRTFTMPNGRWRLPITVADVDPRYLAMLKAYEDDRFDHHSGVDPAAVLRAATQFVARGHVVSGGSTLTMQVARLLEPRERRSLAAKTRQMARALQIERQMQKSAILDLYLGLAPYGGNIEGLRAASLAYFGKEPKRLSIAEAALLVALPQAPEARRPDRFATAARAARDRVLERAARRGVITSAERDSAVAEDVPNARRAFPVLAPHASEAALRREPDVRVHHLTLDAGWQASLETLARDAANRVGPKISIAILAIDNASGAVRAHVGAADYFSQARAGAIDMTQAVRSPGSTLKPFIYALAFQNGIAHPETILDDRPTRYGLYAPENFDLTYQGAVTARHALQLSLNVPAIELLADVGPTRFIAHLRNAGAEIALSPDAAPGLAVGLGGLGITLADLARLYVGLARGGDVPPLVEQAGATPSTPHRQIAEPVASWYVADILRGSPPPPNAPAGRIAFKTGTSYGYRDAFAVGFDGRHTIAVWVGRPDNAAAPGLVGRLAAAPVLFDAFARIGLDGDIPPAPREALLARTATLPPPLRHLHNDMPKTLLAANLAPLKIAYPPDGARVDLGLLQGVAVAAPLALKAQGGVPPFTWLINGAPVGAPDPRRQAAWAADGAGFARVSVMDAQGASDSVLVRLE